MYLFESFFPQISLSGTCWTFRRCTYHENIRNYVPYFVRTPFDAFVVFPARSDLRLRRDDASWQLILRYLAIIYQRDFCVHWRKNPYFVVRYLTFNRITCEIVENVMLYANGIHIQTMFFVSMETNHLTLRKERSSVQVRLINHFVRCSVPRPRSMKSIADVHKHHR